MIRPEKVYKALKCLKKYHPAYLNIKVDHFDIVDEIFDTTDQRVDDDEKFFTPKENDVGDVLTDIDIDENDIEEAIKQLRS